MTDINHRRKNRKPVNQRYDRDTYHNGYASPDNKQHLREVQARADQWAAEHEANGTLYAPLRVHTGAANVGRTDYLNKGGHGWGHKSELADQMFGATIGFDFTNGRRGMARAVHGAKKRARTQLRFHENAATRRLPISEDE